MKLGMNIMPLESGMKVGDAFIADPNPYTPHPELWENSQESCHITTDWIRCL
jgi:hypothetical protein